MSPACPRDRSWPISTGRRASGRSRSAPAGPRQRVHNRTIRLATLTQYADIHVARARIRSGDLEEAVDVGLRKSWKIPIAKVILIWRALATNVLVEALLQRRAERDLDDAQNGDRQAGSRAHRPRLRAERDMATADAGPDGPSSRRCSPHIAITEIGIGRGQMSSASRAIWRGPRPCHDPSTARSPLRPQSAKWRRNSIRAVPADRIARPRRHGRGVASS